jgi:hypothetical protein
MVYEYRIIEGLSRQIQEQLNQAAQEGWEPVHLGTVGQTAASGTAVYVHTTILLRRPAQTAEASPAPQ